MPAGGVGCSPLPCLRRLFTHDDDDSGGGDGVMMTMVMMDGPHCPWVIYNNDAVQCSQFLVLILVMCSFTNVFQKRPATCTRCPSSWADRGWCAGRRASCCVRISGRGRPGGPPGQGTPEGNGGWFPGRHTRRSFRKRVCPRDEAGG